MRQTGCVTPLPTLLTTATLRGDRLHNQDQALVVDGAAAVLDGASSWLPQEAGRDGGWYARSLSSALAAVLPAHDLPLTAVLARAIGSVRDANDLVPGRSPSSTAAIVRWHEHQGRLDALALADSPIVVFLRDGSEDLLVDDRLSHVGIGQHSRLREHLVRGRGFSGPEFHNLVADLQLAEGPRRNEEGGFWVAEAVPASAERAVCRSWALDDVTDVLIMSDGAAAGVSVYGIHSWREVLLMAQRSGLQTVLERVHELEEGDPDGKRWPRTKRHDDKAIVHIRF